ncbi:MAG: cation:proton antiporter [Defluviitaleaceae bacterium]|nr:cation:proton antiporter [Defluviitaleaceae bacterium]
MFIFKLSILFTLGVVLSTVMNKARIPDSLAYITAGVILGPALLNLFNYQDLYSFELINRFAICMVGFSVSQSLNVAVLKKAKFRLVFVSIVQALVTFGVVSVAVFAFSGSVIFALLLGAVSSATAPMIPIMVLRQFQAKGELSDAIVPVIAVDDLVCIVLFYLAFAVSLVLIDNYNFTTLIFEYATMLTFSVIVGLAFGLICVAFFNWLLKSREEYLVAAVSICFACVGLAEVLDLQPTVLAMAAGFVVANLAKRNTDVFETLQSFAPPVFLAFFVATSSIVVMDISHVINFGIIGVVYILARTVGKLFGNYIGAKMFDCNKTVQKYLGVSTLSQAGIILIMSDIILSEIPYVGEQLYIIIRGACVIFLVVGPSLTKFAISRAGEISEISETPEILEIPETHQKGATHDIF